MSVTDRKGVEVFKDMEAVAQAAAEYLFDRATQSVDEHGEFRLALSGGSTPKRLYEILAGPDYREKFPWGVTQLFLGDERFVPHDDDRSNVKLVRESLLKHIVIPERNVHFPRYGEDIAAAAEAYQQQIEKAYGSNLLNSRGVLFDVVLLGLGENGHTASLFPRTPVLEVTDALVGWCRPDDAPNDRLTLTYTAIDSSDAILFLVAGAGKHDVLERVLDGNRAEPAARITTRGEKLWFIDRAAGGEAA